MLAASVPVRYGLIGVGPWRSFPGEDIPYQRTPTNVARKDKPRTTPAVHEEGQSDGDAVFSPPESATAAVHQVENASGTGKVRRQTPSNADRQGAVESKSRPSVVAVFVFASSGHGLDSRDTQGTGMHELTIEDPQPQPPPPRVVPVNVQRFVDQDWKRTHQSDQLNATIAVRPGLVKLQVQIPTKGSHLNLGVVGGSSQSSVLPHLNRTTENPPRYPLGVAPLSLVIRYSRPTAGGVDVP